MIEILQNHNNTIKTNQKSKIFSQLLRSRGNGEPPSPKERSGILKDELNEAEGERRQGQHSPLRPIRRRQTFG